MWYLIDSDASCWLIDQEILAEDSLGLVLLVTGEPEFSWNNSFCDTSLATTTDHTLRFAQTKLFNSTGKTLMDFAFIILDEFLLCAEFVHFLGAIDHVGVFGSVDMGRLAILVFQLDTSFDFRVDFAKTFLLGVKRGESIAGNQKRSRAQWAVLWTSQLGDLFSVKISTKTTSSVSVNVAAINDNTGGIGGNSDSGGNDLDSSVNHDFDLGKVLVQVVGLWETDDFWEVLDLAAIDEDDKVVGQV